MNAKIKKYFNKVNIFFLILIIFLFIIENLTNLTSINKYFICFFLIITIGISHGAYDSHKASKLLYKINKNSKFLFYLTYIGLALIVLYIWQLSPKITLILFLIISSFHFGKEDLEIYLSKFNKYQSIIFFLKGSLIILLPLFFKFNETNEIFNKILFLNEFTLIPNNWINTMLFTNLLFQFFFYLYFFIEKKIISKDLISIFFEVFLIIIIFKLFSTITAFTLYFCFIHSLKNIIVISSELNPNIYKGIKSFALKALPLTIVTFIALIVCLYALSNFDLIENTIQKIIFIGLASLTLPHFLLHFYLKN